MKLMFNSIYWSQVLLCILEDTATGRKEFFHLMYAWELSIVYIKKQLRVLLSLRSGSYRIPSDFCSFQHNNVAALHYLISQLSTRF
ncbi:hypothetical protein UWK_00662 [Desulfocapsa sulfexigens DSM 10523]|uniref:Uncharacterized protein n=1 Tax=Desulfocapsa sulfexigens (strain DSM 10523 / SB164P1) TaxID=1167006 RepID=M1P6A9_DESSD|nr:hypothetical protein UWK_00662 [Desulfocapsa sulfexigens DSM 10523]